MQHKCKVTVIDKNALTIIRKNIWQTLKAARARFTMWATSLFLNATAATIPSGVPATAHSAAKRGLHQPLYLHCASGRQHYARLD